MKSITKKIFSVFYISLLINSANAQNEFNIIGNWIVDSTDIHINLPAELYDLDQEYIDSLEFYINSGYYSAEEFLDDYGFPMPTSQEEWNEILTNGITMEITESEDEIDILGFSITESIFVYYLAKKES